MLDPSQMTTTVAQPLQNLPSRGSEIEENLWHGDDEPIADGGDALPEAVNWWKSLRVVLLGRLLDMLQILMPAVLMALVIHVFLAQATVVYGQSMQPNLNPSERLVIEKFSYYFRAPQRNDIVILDLPGMSDLLVKRVVGLPGETIEIRHGTIFIDNVAQEEPFASISGDASFGPVTLRPLSYFVMGDNRINSNDSRSFGPVLRSAIIGRAWLRYWPLRHFLVLRHGL